MDRSFLRYRRLLGCLGLGVAALACAAPASAQQVIAGKGAVTIDLGVLNQLGQPVSQGYATGNQAYPGYSQPLYGQPTYGQAYAPGYMQTYGGLQFPPQQYPASTLLVQPPAGAAPYVPQAASAPAMTAPAMTAPASTASTATTTTTSSSTAGTPPPAPTPTPAAVPMTTTDTSGAATAGSGSSSGTAASTGSTASTGTFETTTSTGASTATVPSATPLPTTDTTGTTATGTAATASTTPSAPAAPAVIDTGTAATGTAATGTAATGTAATGTAATGTAATGTATTGTAATDTGASGTTQTASIPPAAATEGQIRITFPADSADIPDSVKGQLDTLAQKMASDDNMRIQLLAYASGTSDQASRARRMSLSRALAVRSYLIKQGVRSTRMDVRALGNNVEGSPADRVDIIPKTS